jgi:hypothetical protein
MVEEHASSEAASADTDVRGLIREAVAEAIREQREFGMDERLSLERTQREDLERKLNELIEENHRNRARAEEAERHTAIRTELERLGVAKVELAFRAVKDDVIRTPDGGLAAKRGDSNEDLTSYLRKFLDENPELLPARMTGGSGQRPSSQADHESFRVDLDRIQPGMSTEELERVRQEIVRVANQAFRGM